MKYTPIILTSGNAIAGIVALFFIYQNMPLAVLFLVFLGAVLDGFDGWLARRYGFFHPWGADIDMLADLITFGIVPSIYIAVMSTNPAGMIFGGLYGLAIVFRLLRFKFKEGSDKDLFIGYPSPTAAVAMVAAVNVSLVHLQNLPFLEIATVFFALIAVSWLPWPKWRHVVMRNLPMWFRIVLYGSHTLVLPFYPSEALLSLMMVYVLIGPILVMVHRSRHGAKTGAGAV